MADAWQLLDTLQKSEVFAADFPKRTRLTHAELSQLPEEEHHKLHQPGLDAIRRVKNSRMLADIARQLGAAKYEPAIPTLAAIWRECGLVPLRNAAGHALRQIGTPEARAVLVELIEDSNHLSVFMAVRAIFDAAPMEAFDKLLRYFDAELVRQRGGAVIPGEALGSFAPSSFSREGPQWTEPRAPQWLRADRRWIDLCVRLRRDEDLGFVARNVLRYVEPQLFEPALAAAIEKEGPQDSEPRTRAFGDLLTRYKSGEFVRVWEDLRASGAIAGDFRQEAEAVAEETMRRVAHNLDLLASRFDAKGWVALMGELRTRPTPDDRIVFAKIERITKSPIPPSLLAFWHVVGGVDLVWNYKTDKRPPALSEAITLDLETLDPLCLVAPCHIGYLLKEREHHIKTTHPELLDPFSVDLAPDYLHKADISGGAPYAIDLPFLGADPMFRNERHRLPFVDYLRHCLRWAGFGMLDRHANDSGIKQLIAELTGGFEPF
jgi:hypothetical protein